RQKIYVSIDKIDWVVELVRDTGHEPPKRGHLLLMNELRLRAPQFLVGALQCGRPFAYVVLEEFLGRTLLAQEKLVLALHARVRRDVAVGLNDHIVFDGRRTYDEHQLLAVAAACMDLVHADGTPACERPLAEAVVAYVQAEQIVAAPTRVRCLRKLPRTQ